MTRLERLDTIVAWARSRKAHIEKDGRFNAPPALVQINAPLALIQVALDTEYRCLDAVLKMAEGRSEMEP